MQEAQASCSGGPGLPDSRPISPSTSLPRRPSFSLHLYDRFVKDNAMTAVNQDLMNIDSDIPDAIAEVPPSADDAMSSIPLSTRSSVATPGVPTVVTQTKNPCKRVNANDSPSVNSAKKPASSDSVTGNNKSGSAQGGVPPSSSSTSSAIPSIAIHRYNSKDQPPFIVQVQSTQDTGSSHPLHISRIISQIFPRDILEIRKAGRNKVLVHTSTYETANRLVSNNSLSSHNLQAFIPSYKVLRAGIMRDVPQCRSY